MTDKDEKTCMGLLGGAKKRKVAQNSLDNLRLWRGRKSVDLDEGNAAASLLDRMIGNDEKSCVGLSGEMHNGFSRNPTILRYNGDKYNV